MPEEIIPPSASAEMSFSDKFIGVLSSPGEVFQSIVGTESKASNWVVPLLISIGVAIIFIFAVFNQPAIQDQMNDIQSRKFQQLIDEGKMKQEDVDRALEFSPKAGSPTYIIIGCVFALVFGFIDIVAFSFVFWIGGRVLFKSQAPYAKIMETYGLAFFIPSVTTLLSMVMVIAMGSIYAQPSLALIVPDFDPLKTSHLVLSLVNAFTLWYIVVVVIGMMKVWNVPFVKSLAFVLPVWVAWSALKVLMGIGV